MGVHGWHASGTASRYVSKYLFPGINVLACEMSGMLTELSHRPGRLYPRWEAELVSVNVTMNAVSSDKRPNRDDRFVFTWVAELIFGEGSTCSTLFLYQL